MMMIPSSCRSTPASFSYHSKRYLHKNFQFIKHQKTRDATSTQASLSVNYGNMMSIKDFFIDTQCNAFPIGHDTNTPSSELGGLSSNSTDKVGSLFNQFKFAKNNYGITKSSPNPIPPTQTLNESILSQLKQILGSSSFKKNEELYNFLVNVKKTADPENAIFEFLLKNLSTYQISILLKRLVEYNYYVNKFYNTELRFSSRLNKSDKVSGDLYHTKDSIYLNIFKIIRDIQRLSGYELTISKDYEQLIRFQLDSQRTKVAYGVMKEFDSFVKAGKKNYHITKGIIQDKLKILGNADVSVWKIGRYTVKKVNPGDFPRETKHKSIEYFYKHFPTGDVLVDIDILNPIILNLGYSKDLQLLENFIHNTFGIETNEVVDQYHPFHYNPSENFVKPIKGELTYPNVTTLSNILYSFNYNNELYKGIQLVDEIMKQYSFDKYDLSKFYTALTINVGLLSKNTKRDLTTELWKRGASDLEIGQEFHLQYILIALISQNLANTNQAIFDSNSYISKSLLKVKMTYSSVQGLLNELPLVHSRLTSFLNSSNLYNQRYDYNLLMSYLNIVVVRLSSLNLYYDADKVIQEFSVDEKMKLILRNNLKRFQSRYLKSHKHELNDRGNDEHDFNDTYEEFDGFDTNRTISDEPSKASKSNPTTKKIKKKVDDYDDEDSVFGLW